MKQGGETVIFKEKFSNWSGQLPISVAQVAVGLNTAKVELSGKVDVSKLHKVAQEKEEIMIDDASGTVKIWRIEEFEKVEVDSNLFGHFFSAESYIILYKYIWKNKDCFIIYYYQGRDSSINEKGSSLFPFPSPSLFPFYCLFPFPSPSLFLSIAYSLLPPIPS